MEETKTGILKEYFPLIRERNEVLEQIQSNQNLQKMFESWQEEEQEYLLDICSGVRGVKVLYDAYFKEIMNPDTVPERLEELLSLILKKNVRILKVLPNESARIAAEKNLLVMDIVVELEDGSIANVEVQKCGYQFLGERSSCYSADLLIRQYKRVRSERKKKFKYSDIKKVYTIVFLERSPGVFHEHPEDYIHYSEHIFDTGLELNLLQEYIFIPLDIFHKTYQNKEAGKHNRLEAWLTFLSEENPEEIVRLIREYPDFKELYEDVYRMCRNMERMMGLFSEELAILDRNTVEYMVDEMQKELDQMREEKKALDAEMKSMNAEKKALNEELQSKSEELQSKSEELQSKSEELQSKSEELQNKNEELSSLKAEIETERKIKAGELDKANNELVKLRKKLMEAGIE